MDRGVFPGVKQSFDMWHGAKNLKGSHLQVKRRGRLDCFCGCVTSLIIFVGAVTKLQRMTTSWSNAAASVNTAHSFSGDPGHGGSSPSGAAQTSLSPATFYSSSEGTPRGSMPAGSHSLPRGLILRGRVPIT
ncbi:uncharacterized protein KZ484_009900 [Pholidichthys leucotaenia]